MVFRLCNLSEPVENIRCQYPNMRALSIDGHERFGLQNVALQ
jgi:hypothetical protein